MRPSPRTTLRARERAEKKRLRKAEREALHLTRVASERPDIVAAMSLPDDLPQDVKDSAIETVMGMEAIRITKYQPNAAKAKKYGLTQARGTS